MPKKSRSAQPSQPQPTPLTPKDGPKKRRKPKPVVPRVLQPNAGGVDLGATHLYAAVPPDRTEETVRCFETFTEDLYELAAWFKEHGVTSVAMEATGVLWIPVFYLLERCGIEVFLVNAHHVKHVPGRKTDVQDCQWLQYLHSVGLLRGSFQPPQEIVAVRAVMRHRSNLVQDGARHLQHMQKSLTQMNLQLHHVLSDLSGVTGLAIVDLILAGERDPQVLAQLRQPGVKATEAEVCKALVGDYRPEHLFTLKQARASYQFCRDQMQACDAEIEQYLATLASQVDPDENPPPRPSGSRPAARKGVITLPSTDLRVELYRIIGTDLTQVPSFEVSNVCAIVCEIGVNLKHDFPTIGQFVSWLGLCPNPHVSGGKVLKRGTRPVQQRVATHLRLAAQTLARSQTPLGEYYRRMRAKLGAPEAITATAHRLAKIFYHLVTTKEAYDESVFAAEEERHRQRREARIKREAAALGYTLSPMAEAA